MEIKYYSKLPSTMHLYVIFTLVLIVIGFATLMSPFLIGDFKNEKYNLNQLQQVAQELEEKHIALWENLSLSWKEFWLRKIDSRLDRLYSFANSLHNRLQYMDDRSLTWDKARYVAFYEAFIKSNSLQDILGSDSKLYHYLVDSSGQISLIDGSIQPSWENLNDLRSIEDLLYFDSDVSKFLRNAKPTSYLQSSLELGIAPDSTNAVLTFLFSDFAMENSNLRFAISVELSNVSEYSRNFFTWFKGKLNFTNDSYNPLKIMLITIDETEDASYYFKTYDEYENRNNYYNLRNQFFSNRYVVLYEEVAELILSVTNPTSYTALINPNLNFLFSTIDRVERGKRLNLALQMKGYMQPFIVNNLYGSLDDNITEEHIPRMLSVGKMWMLPASHNLVLLDSIVDQTWWDTEPFINTGYHSKLRNMILLFASFFVILLIPLLCYTYFMKRYAKDFFDLKLYIMNLPSAESLIGKHDGKKNNDVRTKVTQANANSALSKRIISEVQQRFVKLGEAVDYWREQSSTDELTGLLNRKGLNQICAYETSRMKRSGSSFSLILLDIDKFKNINDQYGHEVGDLALNSLAKLLVSTFRISDYLSRWGGEEFLIILPDTSLPGAIQVAESARQSVEKMMVQSRETSLQMTISIGVACCSPDSSFVDMLNYADKSLYQAKQSGRNQVWAYSEEEGVYAIPSSKYRKSLHSQV